MTINLRAEGIELTEAIRQYVEEKFGTLEKYESRIIQIDVDLLKETEHHQKGQIFGCTANVQVPGDVLRVEKQEEDLYKAIDKVKDHLREVLTERKERERDSHRKAE